MAKFDTDQLVADCLEAVCEDEAIPALSEIVSRAISEPLALDRTFPVPIDPDDDGILFRSAELTVASAIFPRGFATGIHNHTMPAVIGVWTGFEDNDLYRNGKVGVTQIDSVRVGSGEVLALDEDAIHEVRISDASWSGALHVYLGDLIGTTRTEWSGEPRTPRRFDGELQNRRWTKAAKETGLLIEP